MEKLKTLDDLEITEEDLRLAQEASEIHYQQLKHPYVFDLIKVLAGRPRLKRSIALDWIHANRIALSLPIPRTFNETVQATVNYYCQDSDVFKNRRGEPSDALFRWPSGKGKGFWAVDLGNPYGLTTVRPTILPAFSRAMTSLIWLSGSACTGIDGSVPERASRIMSAISLGLPT